MRTLKSFKQWRHKLIQRWLNKRIPAVSRHVLRYRQIFIFPTKVGFGYAGLVLIILIGATNYQNNLAFALVFWLVSLGFLAIAYTFRNLLNLDIRGLPIPAAFAGDRVQTDFLIVSTHQHQAIGLGLGRQVQTIIPSVNQSPTRTSININAPIRGIYQLPRIYIETQYPLGIIHAWSWLRFNQTYWIYPQPIQPPLNRSNEGINDDDADAESIQGRGDDFHGLKQYEPGDSPKRIDWKAYARERGLHTKDMRTPQSNALWFRWQDFPGATPELRLSYICYLVCEAAKEDAEFGISIPGFKSALSHGDSHKRLCLESLASWGEEPTVDSIVSDKSQDNDK
jgi:uncharacterized protein (DUF58 family)